VPDLVDRGIAGSAAVGMEQFALELCSGLQGAGIPGVRRRVVRLDTFIPDQRGRLPIREPSGPVSTEWVGVPALSLDTCRFHACSLPNVHLNVTLCLPFVYAKTRRGWTRRLPGRSEHPSERWEVVSHSGTRALVGSRNLLVGTVVQEIAVLVAGTGGRTVKLRRIRTGPMPGSAGGQIFRPMSFLVTAVLAVSLAGCGRASTTPGIAAKVHGQVTGLAQQCAGLPRARPYPVEVTLRRGDRLLARQTQLGSHTYRFSEPPGTYVVTTNQSYVVPVTVRLRAGQVVHADLWAACS